jgi:putative tryptophan/tyrosine transport system substrate-binding protein
MQRRSLVQGLAAAMVVPAFAARSPCVIGWLSHHARDTTERIIAPVLARLAAHGQVQGRDYRLEVRYGNRDPQRMARLARELAALQPTLVVAPGNAAAEALKLATREVPIVAWGVNAPVETGLVASLAHPGCNVTGTTFSPPEMGGKLLEMLKVAAPSLHRVVVVVNPGFGGVTRYSPSAMRTAQALHLELVSHAVPRAEDFHLETLEAQQPDALYVTSDYAVERITPQLIAYALQHKIPSIGVLRRFATAGGLMAMGPNQDEMEENLVEYILRIAAGASAASLPVREPARLAVVLNRSTARATGVPLSQELLVRVSELVG